MNLTGFKKAFIIPKYDYDTPEFDNGVWLRQIKSEGSHTRVPATQMRSDGSNLTAGYTETFTFTSFDEDVYQFLEDLSTARTECYLFVYGLSNVVWLEPSLFTVEKTVNAETGDFLYFIVTFQSHVAGYHSIWSGKNLLSPLHSSAYETDITDRWTVANGTLTASTSFTNSVGDTLVIEQSALGTNSTAIPEINGVALSYPCDVNDKFTIRADLNISNQASSHSASIALIGAESDGTSAGTYSEATTSTGDVTLAAVETLSDADIKFFNFRVLAGSSGTGDVDLVKFDNLGLYFGTTTTEYQED